MYNLRYHIASLVAVFLALSIGLLLGSVVVERGILDRQRVSIVQGLQEQFESLGAENRELSAELALRDDFAQSLVKSAFKDTLEDKTVLVLTSVGRADGLGAVGDAITQAGGASVTFVLAQSSFGLADPAVAEVASQTVGPVEPDALLPAVADALAAEWASPAESRPLTAALVEAGVLRIEDDAGSSVGVDGVVTLAYFSDAPDDGALALASALAALGQPAVGAETQMKATGVALAASEAGLSAVDHVTTPEGEFSLIWILSSQAQGYFGYGDGAQSPWPR